MKTRDETAHFVDETSVSGIAPGFETRLSAVCSDVGTKKKAAEVAGISEDSLHRYIRGETKVSLDPMAKLCAYTGKTLDWLVTGKAPTLLGENLDGSILPPDPKTNQIDPDLFAKVVGQVEQFQIKNKIDVDPLKKGELILAVYFLTANTMHYGGDYTETLAKIEADMGRIIRLATN
ncbi:MAG: helix-turn-helix transcriptional regulator [Rhodospirillales bacterium]|nr:helix-turn-helix transcriptional regulator [Rhodospirillales bacterium]